MVIVLPGDAVQLEEIDISWIKEGDIIFQGTLGFAFVGMFTSQDTEFVRTDGGVFIWDTQKFRGIGHIGQRVRGIKKGGDIVIEKIL